MNAFFVVFGIPPLVIGVALLYGYMRLVWQRGKLGYYNVPCPPPFSKVGRPSPTRAQKGNSGLP